MRQLPQILSKLPDPFANRMKSSINIFAHLRRDHPLDRLHVEIHQSQPLSNVVMQIPGDALALLLLGRKKTCSHCSQLLTSVFQDLDGRSRQMFPLSR